MAVSMAEWWINGYSTMSILWYQVRYPNNKDDGGFNWPWTTQFDPNYLSFNTHEANVFLQHCLRSCCIMDIFANYVCRERLLFLRHAIKYCWYGARLQNLQCRCSEDIYSLALNHWHIPGNTRIIIVQFIHIVQVEILLLPRYVHDLKQDNWIFIPKVLEIPVFCSKPTVSYRIFTRKLTYKGTTGW